MFSERRFLRGRLNSSTGRACTGGAGGVKAGEIEVARGKATRLSLRRAHFFPFPSPTLSATMCGCVPCGSPNNSGGRADHVGNCRLRLRETRDRKS